jgi:hypothetical protein
MHATLLVFLAAAWLDALALDFFLAGKGSRRSTLVAGAATGGVLLLAAMAWFGALPASWPLDAGALSRYLVLVAFFAVLLQLCRPLPATGASSGQRSRTWLRLLPLLVANAVVLACAALGPAWLPDSRVALMTSAGATLAMLGLLPVGNAFLHRLRLGAPPSALKGAPMTLLSAAIAALGASGGTAWLPW